MHLRPQQRLGVGDAAAPVTVVDRDFDAARSPAIPRPARYSPRARAAGCREALAQPRSSGPRSDARRHRHHPEIDLAGRLVAFGFGGLQQAASSDTKAGPAARRVRRVRSAPRRVRCGEQPPADRTFQRRDLPAENGLGDAERAGGTGVTAIGGDFDKGLEPAQFHRFGYTELAILNFQEVRILHNGGAGYCVRRCRIPPPCPLPLLRTGPLAGLRVLDISTVVAGPFAADAARRPRRRCAQGGNAGRGRLRCAAWRRTRTACRCGGRSPTATRKASRSTCASRRARRCSAVWSPSATSGREFPHRHARRLGHHPGLAAGHQSPTDDPAHHRLRPDRALSQIAPALPASSRP